MEKVARNSCTSAFPLEALSYFRMQHKCFMALPILSHRILKARYLGSRFNEINHVHCFVQDILKRNVPPPSHPPLYCEYVVVENPVVVENCGSDHWYSLPPLPSFVLRYLPHCFKYQHSEKGQERFSTLMKII